jgi:hypothetical protein
MLELSRQDETGNCDTNALANESSGTGQFGKLQDRNSLQNGTSGSEGISCVSGTG